jgi:hypothetical protein
MRVIKMLGAALIGFAAFIGVSANAQTPVACSWTVVSSYGPPDNSYRNIVRECRESNNTLVATQSFVGYSSGAVQNCVLTPAANITYTGACISPSFFRNAASSSSAQSSRVVSSVSACATPGVRVQGGCANSFDSSMLTNPTYLSRCGSGCTLEYRTIGWTSACPNSGNGRSPEYGLFCK